MKIYLINLERSVDRRSHMLSELLKLAPGVPIKRAFCKDIKDINWSMPKDIRPGRWKSDRWALGPSDVEIFRSHVDCWEKISLSDEMGIVLEDDLVFSNNFAKIVELLNSENINGIIRLDGVNLPLLMSKSAEVNHEFHISRINSIAASAAAYALDPNTARDLVSKFTIDRTLDDYLFDPTPSYRGARGHTLPIYQIEPIVAVQAQFGNYSDSSIQLPVFLKATKRIDTKNRKVKSLQGPPLYRLKKEILRIIHRKRLKRLKKNIICKNGEWKVPDLSKDLTWN